MLGFEKEQKGIKRTNEAGLRDAGQVGKKMIKSGSNRSCKCYDNETETNLCKKPKAKTFSLLSLFEFRIP